MAPYVLNSNLPTVVGTVLRCHLEVLHVIYLFCIRTTDVIRFNVEYKVSSRVEASGVLVLRLNACRRHLSRRSPALWAELVPLFSYNLYILIPPILFHGVIRNKQKIKRHKLLLINFANVFKAPTK